LQIGKDQVISASLALLLINSGADLYNARLNYTFLVGANLSDATLESAFLVGATLVSATLSGANLSGADLTYTNNLTQQQLDQVYSCKKAFLPSGLTCHRTP